MTALFDLNNEMILMRKDIKRAKLWAISRLVRHVRNLRNKKGNEAKKAKNLRRAERLVEEIGLIKELKPDDIFKALLSCDLGSEELMNGAVSLEKRAVIRVGSAHFIQTRVDGLKLKIEEFQSHHGSKPPSKALSEGELTVVTSSDVEEKSKQLTSRSEETLPSTACIVLNGTERHARVSRKNRKSVTRVSTLLNGETFSTKTRTGLPKERRGSGSPSDDNNSSGDTDGGDLLEEKPSYSDRLKVEERVEGMSDDRYQIVIPCDNAREISKKKYFDLFAEAGGTDDITDLLPNIGANFDSDDDLKGLSTSAETKQQTTVKECHSDREDQFFVSAEGGSNNPFGQRRQTGCKHATRVEDESQSQVKSCFLESLASVSHQRTKGKNRMSQRARKKFSYKKVHDENSDNARVKKTQDSKGKTVRSGDNASKKSNEPQPLHPSWEASRKRKQAQSVINNFQGKRVCFEDSD